MFIIVMVMSCDIVSDIAFMLYFLCRISVTVEANKFIYLSSIVSTISVNGIVVINNNIISKSIICFLYIMCLLVL